MPSNATGLALLMALGWSSSTTGHPSATAPVARSRAYSDGAPRTLVMTKTRSPWIAGVDTSPPPKAAGSVSRSAVHTVLAGVGVVGGHDAGGIGEEDAAVGHDRGVVEHRALVRPQQPELADVRRSDRRFGGLGARVRQILAVVPPLAARDLGPSGCAGWGAASAERLIGERRRRPPGWPPPRDVGASWCPGPPAQ